eukprot:CAMPEP_0172327738 /NCGR_PEP_ID=MMETSP1058-20130122/59989_1 /TAXON_ID=83371 /ORGANISM="Detonula confervacea, Strain CCMP 353" /LENGTH=659 /DNA_ID=CAMNT_0013044821 /DNA_START=186 /DNA_END=2165 /DNA_ORIENTATION=+
MTPPSVAVIGCGPAGMFFLHALALRRAKLEEEGNVEALVALPTVTCFERAPGPGGVWRSDRFKGDNSDGAKSTNMYEALWTNGPKEAMEFFDHTYDEHFGQALPTFLPRDCVLEYILKRCTKNNPNFFDDVEFNTSVESVEYDEELSKFSIKLSGISKSQSFDWCIWAAGENGKPKFPPFDAFLKSRSQSQGFKGKVMHSSQTDSNFEDYVRGKNIMVIGDSYSAEDLTLQAIKLGVESVEIVTRGAKGAACSTGAWPMDKVDINEHYIPTGITADGRGVVLSKVKYDYDQVKYEEIAGRTITLDEIDTIIYCTGYDENSEMLDKELMRSKYPDYKSLIDTIIYCTGYDENSDMLDKELMRSKYPDYKSLLTGWKMTKNALSKDLGDIPPGDFLQEPPFVYPEYYRGRLLSVPNMMFLCEEVDVPLFGLDIAAWLLLAQITGDLPLPSPQERKKFNMETLGNAMNDPYFRLLHDSNYAKQWRMAIGDDHWAEDHSNRRSKDLERSHLDLQYRFLARDAQDSGYPLQLGTFEKLNKKGKALVECNMVADYARYDLNKDSADASWRTFRDCDPSKCKSIFTGTRAVRLKRRWLELDSCKTADIVGETTKEEASLKSLRHRIQTMTKGFVAKLRKGGDEELEDEEGSSKLPTTDDEVESQES